MVRHFFCAARWALLFMLFGVSTWGADFYWIQNKFSGNWNDASNWTLTAGSTSPASTYPQAGDNAYISEAATITVPIAVTIESLTVSAPNGSAIAATLSGAGNMGVDFIVLDRNSGTNVNFTMGVPCTVSAGIDITDACALTVTNSMTVTAAVSLSGTAQLNVNSGAMVQCDGIQTTSGTSTLTVNGMLTTTGDISVHNGTVGSSGTLTIDSTNLAIDTTWNNSGTVVTSGPGTATSLPSGAVESGTWRYTGGTVWTASGFTYHILDVAGMVNVHDSCTTDTLTVQNSGQLSVPAGGSVTVSSAFTNSGTVAVTGSGSVMATVATWNNTGTITLDATGTVTPPASPGNEAGTWTYMNTTGRSLVPHPYYHLTVSGAGAVTASAAVSVGNALTINSGASLVLGDYDLTVSTSFTNNGTVTVGNGAVNLPAPRPVGNWIYANSSARDLIDKDYTNLTLSGATVTAVAAVTVTEDLIIQSGSTLDLVSFHLTVNGKIVNYGTVRLIGDQTISANTITNNDGSTVTYYGNTGTWKDGGTVIPVQFGSAYYNLVCDFGAEATAAPLSNGKFGKQLQFTGSVTVRHNLRLRGVSLPDEHTIVVTGTASASITLGYVQDATDSNAVGNYLHVMVDLVTVTGLGSSSIKYTAFNSRGQQGSTPSSDVGNDVMQKNGWFFPRHLLPLENVICIAPLGGKTLYVHADDMRFFTYSAEQLWNLIRIVDGSNNSAAGQGIASDAIRLIQSGGTTVWCAIPLEYPVTLSHITDYYLRYKVNETDSKPAFHALSDFAVGAVTSVLAYDNGTVTDISTQASGQPRSGRRVQDFNAEANNALQAERSMTITATEASAAVTGVSVGDLTLVAARTVPTAGRLPPYIPGAWRVWLPSGDSWNNPLIPLEGGFTQIRKNSDAYELVYAEADEQLYNAQNITPVDWKTGDQVTFLFQLDDYVVCHTPEVTSAGKPNISATSPLYALRFRTPDNILSLDLWSFKLASVALQAGGVTILNNVININAGDVTTLNVSVPKSGQLRIIVMALDGSIVTYLAQETAAAGARISAQWDGRTASGTAVARGLYFVRVIGCGIDETRKVMVVH
ncbi:MAG: hypothetical protein IJ191_09295 [Treponema sp.]|nr:hypothetical protein [Treponema sp.]